MWPIESLFFVVGIIIAVIGFTRGHAKESGVSLVLLTVVFLLSFLDERLFRVLAGVVGPITEDPNNPDNFLYLLIFWGIIIVITYASYAGNALNLNPNKVAAPLGMILDLFIGLLNGYLVAGMLWYYLDKFSYPMPSIFELPLTAEATQIIPYLPPTFFPSAFFWVLPIVVVLLLKIIG